MLLFYKLFLGALFLCDYHSYAHSESSEPRIFQYTREFDSANCIFLEKNKLMNSNDLLFASCACKKPGRGLLCNVTVDTPAFLGSVYTDTCSNIKLPLVDDSREIIRAPVLDNLISDRVSLTWVDRRKSAEVKKRDLNLNLLIIYMANCSTVNISIPIESYVFNTDMLLYTSTFEIILASKAACAGTDKCRIMYDYEGKQVGKPKPLQIEENFGMFTVANHSPDKGYYQYIIAEDHNNSHLKVMYINPEGAGTELMKKPAFVNPASDLIVSKTDELLSTCWWPEDFDFELMSTHLHCAQFDSTTTKIRITLTFPEPRNLAAVYSLPIGGFLVVVGKCELDYDDNCDGFRIYTIRPNGQKDKPLELQNFFVKVQNFLRSFVMRISESDKNEYCFHFTSVVIDHREYNKLMYKTICIQKKNISMPYKPLPGI